MLLGRRSDLLEDSLGRLDALWARLRSGAAPADAVRGREALALLATSRWMYRSALARPETRGMARRAEHPGLDPTQHHRLVSGGLDEVWTRTEAVTPPPTTAATLERQTA